MMPMIVLRERTQANRDTGHGAAQFSCSVLHCGLRMRFFKECLAVPAQTFPTFPAKWILPPYPNEGSRSEMPNKKMNPMMQLYAAPVHATR